MVRYVSTRGGPQRVPLVVVQERRTTVGGELLGPMRITLVYGPVQHRSVRCTTEYGTVTNGQNDRDSGNMAL